jgi:uncharacterized membrane protein
MDKNILKSILALLVGFVVVVILSLGTDVVLHKLNVFPPWGESLAGYDRALLLATIYRSIFGVIGSYSTARLAPNRPMGHALVGGVIGLVLSIVGAAATWNKGPAFGPHWYPLALVVLALPQSRLGGKICVMQSSVRAEG